LAATRPESHWGDCLPGACAPGYKSGAVATRLNHDLHLDLWQKLPPYRRKRAIGWGTPFRAIRE
jgi:hypothetical protein